MEDKIFILEYLLNPAIRSPPPEGWIHSRTILHFLTDFATEGVQSPGLNCNWHCRDS